MKKRFVAMAAATAFAAWGWSQDATRELSFESNAAPLPVLLDRLSAASGVRLTASAGLAREVLAVRFRDTSLESAKTRIAAVLGANWVKEPDGWRLVANDSARQADWKAEIKLRADAYARSIERFGKEALTGETIDSAEARRLAERARELFSARGGPGRGGGPGGLFNFFNSLTARSPGGRAIAQLLREMNPSDLATIAPGSRVVFAAPANRAQSALPASSWRIVESFLREQAAFVESMRAGQGDGPLMPFVEAMAGASGRPAKVYLIASRPPIGETLTLEFVVANQEGRTMGFGFGSLSGDLFAEEPEQAASPEEEPIAVGDVGKTLANLLGESATGGSGAVTVTTERSGRRRAGNPVGSFFFMDGSFGIASQPRPKLSPEVRSFVLNPERSEPLSTAPGELYLGLAKVRGKNLVALLPDRLFQPANRRAAAGPVRPGDVLMLSRTTWRMDVREADGWLMVRPLDAATARAGRVDRSALGAMLRVLDQQGELRLSALAAYARTMPAVGNLDGLDLAYLRVVDPATASREISRMFTGGRDMLRLYASLSDPQRQALEAGRPLSIASMTSDQRAIVNQIVFHSFDGPRVEGTRGRGREGMRGAIFGMGDVRSERTEVLAAGIPLQAELRMTKEEEVAILASNSATKASQAFSPNSLGRMLAWSERPEFAAFTANSNFDEFRVGREIEYEFTFLLGPNVSMRRELSDTTFDRAQRGVALAALPDPIRTQIERSKAEASRSNRGDISIFTAPGGQREP